MSRIERVFKLLRQYPTNGDINEEVLKNMYAVLVTGGKQFRVSEGDEIEVEKLDGEVGDKVELKSILKVDGEAVSTEAGSVTAEILGFGKGKKVTVFKYKAKKNSRKKQGHRQPYTRIKILSI